MIDVFVSDGKLLVSSHLKELEDFLEKLDFELEIELQSPCG